MTAHAQNLHIINMADKTLPVLQRILRTKFKKLNVLVQLPDEIAFKISRDYYNGNIKYETGFTLLVHPQNYSSTYHEFDFVMVS